MKLSDINIRDPFILPYEGVYYMYGTRGADCWQGGSGFDVYTSRDLVAWSDPIEVYRKTPEDPFDINFWAPEVHLVDGAFYMFASFKPADRERGTWILRSDSPTGPFIRWSASSVTPEDWSSLDGTYWEEDGKRYVVFCHEWTQIGDGHVCARELSRDLKTAVGNPVTLFKGSDLYLADAGKRDYVTDGPFLVRAGARLLLLWSSNSDGKYREAVAESDGGVLGPWRQQQRYLFADDGGHGMVFTGFDGVTYFTMHTPNRTPDERPKIIPIEL